jgi:hypothetical protein
MCARTNSGLARAINTQALKAPHARNGASHDDRPPIPHQGQRSLYREQRPSDIDVERVVEVFFS